MFLGVFRGAALAAALGMTAVWGLVAAFALPVLSGGQAGQVFSWRWLPDAGQFGILPMLAGSLALSLLALILALPLALGLACRLRLDAARGGASPVLRLVRGMTTIPTVVYGFSSLFLLIPLLRAAAGGSGLCWLAAALVLALLILPTIVLVMDAALEAVSRRTALTATALGFSPAQHLAWVALPAARTWLFSAGMLGFGRAVGDTLIPLMLSGNAAQTPHSLLAPLRTLSAHMGLATATEAGSAAYNSLFIAAALLCGISVLTSLILRRITARPGGEAVGISLRLRWLPTALRGLAATSILVVGGCVGTLLLFLLWRGLPSLGTTLFFGDTPALAAILGQQQVWDGIWPACVGTLCLLGLSMLLALPPGLCCGIYLAEYAGPRAKKTLSIMVDTMAGMPSIVLGFFGFLLIIFLRRTLWPEAQQGLLLSALCMALLVLPVLIVSTRTALESLPASLRLTGHALGLSPASLLGKILLPQASRGILGGVMLAMGRAAEDTAVIILTGVVANAGLPSGLNMRFEALPFMIYYTAAQYQDAAELARGFGAALMLLCVSGGLLLTARACQRRYARGGNDAEPSRS